MATIEQAAAAYAVYQEASVDKTISPTETMNNQWYFDVGHSAIRAIILAWQASNCGEVHKILDLPSGHGRVLRHLVKLFPKAQVDACDIDREGIDFCASQFGAHALLSQEDLTAMIFETRYDLIWVGSLFTHISRPLAAAWLKHLASALSPTGFLVGTTHGRWSEFVHKYHPYISPEGWNKVLEGFHSSGYGYCDYQRHENHSYIEGSYGVSMVRPEITVTDLAAIPDTRLMLYRERGWADHQDIFAIGKPAFSDRWPGMTT